ncbi:MAG: Mur ligase family protein [Patescibacteria group bacterium]
MKKILKKIIVWILRLEARLVLMKYKPKIVAVTGSVGKTTAKDAIYVVLSSAFFARKSEKSFNSEIGVPLTILGCENAWSNPLLWVKNIFIGLGVVLLKNHYPKWLVLEVGTDAPGDIESLAKWLKPDIAVLTRFAKVPVHVEFFKSPQAVMEEKKKLVKYLKAGGLLIKNCDDEDINSIKAPKGAQIISFGYNTDANILGMSNQIIYKNSIPVGTTFRVEYAGASVPVVLDGVLGKQHTYSALAALTVGISQKLNIVSVAQALTEGYKPQPGRMKLLEGIKGTTLIDDSYNASPIAMEKALELLRELVLKEGGKKIAVLGDMLELGKYSTEEHKKIGRLAAKICDVLITVGLRSKDITDGALLGGMSEKNILQFDNSTKAGKFLQNQIEKGDVILVKGSQSMRMEKTLEEIMAHPELKDELLVRQDAEWLLR